MTIKKIILFILIIIANNFVFSQSNYWYYGKNRVQLQSFDWHYVETEHFHIYHYVEDQKLIQKIALAAESGYNRISDYLNFKIKDKIPLIFYSSHIDFEQNNIIGYTPSGVMAFAESTAYRVVIQGDSSFEDLSATITHELGHIFEYEIMGRMSHLISPPLWVLEGFSDFITGGWDQFSLLTVRDSVLNGSIPVLQKDGDIYAYNSSNRTPYDFGHLIYEFIEDKFGRHGVRKLINNLKKGGFLSARQNIIEKTFDYSPKLFNYEFGKYARERFKQFQNKENPEDYSIRIGPDFPYIYSFSHLLSPSGELIAVLTVNQKAYDLDIILISAKDGKVIKNITPGFSSKYDYINLKFDPSDGISFAWNNQSDTIAFFARHELFNYLIVSNVLSGEISHRIKLEKIQDPASPVFSADQKKIYFTAIDKAKAYIYSIDLSTQKIEILTDGSLYIRSFHISPIDDQIIISAKASNFYKLYLSNLKNLNYLKPMTSGDYNDITPRFSKNGKTIYYSSDELESFNIYSLDLANQSIYRYTDVKTGNFFPVEIPDKPEELLISSFYKNTFSLYKKDVSKFLEKQPLPDHAFSNAIDLLKDFQDDSSKKDSLEKAAISERRKYKPFNKVFVKSMPPITISLATNGGFWGSSYLTLTDLMGDHNLSLLLSSYYGYRSFHLYYLNQKHRLQPYTHFFSYKDVYYYNNNYYQGIAYDFNNYLTIRSKDGGEAGLYYPFNRSYRTEATMALYKQRENSDIYSYGEEIPYGQFFDGWAVPFNLSFVGETTRFANFGPLSGHTFRINFQKFIKFGSGFQDAYSMEFDIRKYLKISNDTLFAFRLNGMTSGGKNALLFWTGGNNTIRSVDLYSFIGNNVAFFNAEFRFPLIHLALTPIGLVGPVRGTFFFDIGSAWFNDQSIRIFEPKEGLQLRDAIASYGFGIEAFIFGYPFHFEWVTRTNFDQKKYYGLNFWIGFDF